MHGEGRNTDIEALRGYAIAITVVAHMDWLIPGWSGPLTYFWLGGGVDLFFVISGFVITRTLLRQLQGQPSFARFAVRFWLRRAFRLWPAALLWSSLYTVAAIGWIWTGDPAMQTTIASNWLFSALNLQNLHVWLCLQEQATCRATALWHYWSLSLEEQFYVLIPMALFVVRPRHWLILPLLAIALLQSFSVRHYGDLAWFIRSDAILYGVLIALAWSRYGDSLERIFDTAPRRVVQFVLALGCVAIVLVARPAASPYFMGMIALSAAVVVLAVSGDRNLLTAHPAARQAAMFLGARSYSIYLIHLPAISLVNTAMFRFGGLDGTAMTNQVVGVAASLALMAGLAEFSWRFVENPLRAVGVRLTRNPAEQAPHRPIPPLATPNG